MTTANSGVSSFRAKSPNQALSAKSCSSHVVEWLSSFEPTARLLSVRQYLWGHFMTYIRSRLQFVSGFGFPAACSKAPQVSPARSTFKWSAPCIRRVVASAGTNRLD